MADKPNEKSKSTQKTDDVGKKDKGKGPKAPAKSSSSEDATGNAILECLKSIQASQTELAKRVDDMEKKSANSDYLYYPEGTAEEGSAVCDFEYDDEQYTPSFGPPSPKRSRVDPESRFAGLAKKFKAHEVCSAEVDGVLADNANDLFRKGMDEELYEKTVKDENCARPENCDGLAVAKMNKLVWDVMSQQSRTLDKKMQSIATSIVKAGVFLVKTMDLTAKMEKVIDKSEADQSLTEVIDGCNDSLALLGHANYQINMTRRDLLRPELKREYAHLCTRSLPVTKELFGDDISKTAKEIEDFAKIGHRMSGQMVRGGYRGRPGYRGRGVGPAFRGRYGGTPMQSTSKYRAPEPKNLSRRGGARTYQKN